VVVDVLDDEDERLCPSCGDWWPDDEEFYHPGQVICIACELEPIERRRATLREAQRRHRARELLS
jgi:hypothetical protein